MKNTKVKNNEEATSFGENELTIKKEALKAKRAISELAKKSLKSISKKSINIEASIKSLDRKFAVIEKNWLIFERSLPDVVAYLHKKYEGKGISPKTLGGMAKSMMKFRKG